MDNIDLNEACSKDSFPLSQIDQIVDASAGHGMFSFLDTFSGYHQIPMHSSDAEKTTFITPHELYCYNVMPFGLMLGQPIRGLMTKIFRPLIGRTMEVYIDDMLPKTKERPDHMKHLEETFELLHTNGMKLDPLKRVFGVNLGKFLGFMVTQREIEANPIQLTIFLHCILKRFIMLQFPPKPTCAHLKCIFKLARHLHTHFETSLLKNDHGS